MTNFFALIVHVYLFAMLAVAEPVHAEAIVVVTNKDSHISSLTNAQVKRIFLAKLMVIDDELISIVNQQKSSAIRDDFYLLATGQHAQRASARWAGKVFSGEITRSPLEFDNPEALKNWLKATPNAISYLYESELTEQLKVIFRIDRD